MYPVHLVCLFDAEDHLSHVLFGDLFAQGILSDEQTQEVTADTEVHDEVEVLDILEGSDQWYDPFRAFSGDKEIPFRSQMTLLGVAQHVCFANHFHGVDLLIWWQDLLLRMHKPLR